jgi:hypothetical protein
MARWEYIDKQYFDELYRTGNAEGLIKAETENILLDNNTFWRAEHKQGIFNSLKNAFIEFGLDGCRCRFMELVNAGKTGKLSIIGDEYKDIKMERISIKSKPRRRTKLYGENEPDYEAAILARQENAGVYDI